jgi:hypothetical protein
MKAPGARLNYDQLQTAIAAATGHFALVRKKYPELKMYLVLSLPSGQTRTGSSPEEILKEFPTMVVNDAAKALVLDFLKTPEPKDASDSEKKRLKEQLANLASELSYDGDCRIEIRFDALDYELLWQLQSDELVDLALTPQTRASIRIVLGTLSRFAGSTHSSTHS